MVDAARATQRGPSDWRAALARADELGAQVDELLARADGLEGEAFWANAMESIRLLRDARQETARAFWLSRTVEPARASRGMASLGPLGLARP